MSGKPLTLEERYLIHAGFVGGLGVAMIAKQLRRHRSVIYDERARGRDQAGHYCPHRAQMHREHASAKSAANSHQKSAAEWDKVGREFKRGWSPEQISGRRALLNGSVPISIPAIYAAVERYAWEAWLHTSRLRRHLKRPARRVWEGDAQSIHERAKDVLSRIEMGHWEADTAVGKKKDNKRLLVIVERQSLYMELTLQTRFDAQATSRSMQRRLGKNGIPFESVTTDRGSEFAATGRVFSEKAFVCDPHAPNQRGTNENQIGMLRADLPKGVTMNDLTHAKVRHLQDKYNHKPRKCLGFLTPYEVAFNCPPRVGTRT